MNTSWFDVHIWTFILFCRSCQSPGNKEPYLLNLWTLKQGDCTGLPFTTGGPRMSLGKRQLREQAQRWQHNCCHCSLGSPESNIVFVREGRRTTWLFGGLNFFGKPSSTFPMTKRKLPESIPFFPRRCWKWSSPFYLQRTWNRPFWFASSGQGLSKLQGYRQELANQNGCFQILWR